MIRGLDHLQVAIPKGREREARQFYGELLGLEEIEKPDSLKHRGGVWYKLGDWELHLGVEEDFRPAKKAHPAFQVEDLAALATRLEAKGYPRIADEVSLGYPRYFSNDPFGNRLEFLSRQAST